MSQPDGAPPKKWIERVDGTTALNMMRLDMETLAEKTATKNWVYGLLGGCAALIVGAAWLVSSKAAGEAKDVAAEVRKTAADDVRQIRAETAAKVERIETKVDGIYKLLVEGKSRSAVRQEVENKTKEQP